MARDNYKIGDNSQKKQHSGKPFGLRVVEKPKDFKSSWKNMLIFAKAEWSKLICAILCACISCVLMLIGPDKLKQITNLITSGFTSGINLSQVASIGLTLIAIYLLSAVLGSSQNILLNYTTQNVCKNMRTRISQKINNLPFSYFAKTKTGDVLSKVTNDVDTIGQSINQSIGSLVTSVTMLVGSVFMMLITNIIMTITAIGATIIGFSLMAIIMKNSQKFFKAQQKALGDLNGHIEEVYAGHNVVKANNGEILVKSQFQTLNNSLNESSFKAQSLAGLMMPIMGFIGNFGYVAICVVGSMLALNGSISIGVIVAFMIYVRYFTQPLSQIAQAMQILQSAAAAGERVFSFLNTQELSDESKMKHTAGKVLGNVEFKNVRFGYDEDRVIINDFSAKAFAGQKIAIVGPTGAGKTTIVNLLMRFYEINQPRLIINGVLTDYQIFNNGKSIVLMVDDSNILYIGDETTAFTLDNDIANKLPKNTKLKFDQNFVLSANGSPILSVSVLSGNQIDTDCDKTQFGVAYYGDIFIDNVPTKSLSREAVHSMFCMVLQDTWLFNGTVKENLVYNATNVSDEEIENACRAVGIDHFIRTLPQNYDTVLTDQISLSQGQKQELTIARAIIANRPMLILDEATSSVDTRTEVNIQKAMDILMQNRTSFIIAHRLSTIKNADLILVLKDGDIIESGTHKNLLEKQGFYCSLYNSQFND